MPSSQAVFQTPEGTPLRKRENDSFLSPDVPLMYSTPHFAEIGSFRSRRRVRGPPPTGLDKWIPIVMKGILASPVLVLLIWTFYVAFHHPAHVSEGSNAYQSVRIPPHPRPVKKKSHGHESQKNHHNNNKIFPVYVPLGNPSQPHTTSSVVRPRPLPPNHFIQPHEEDSQSYPYMSLPNQQGLIEADNPSYSMNVQGQQAMMQSNPLQGMYGQQAMMQSNPSIPMQDQNVLTSPQLMNQQRMMLSSPQMTMSGQQAMMQSNPQMMVQGQQAMMQSNPQMMVQGQQAMMNANPQMMVQGQQAMMQSNPQMTVQGQQAMMQPNPQMTVQGQQAMMQSNPLMMSDGSTFGEIEGPPQTLEQASSPEAEPVMQGSDLIAISPNSMGKSLNHERRHIQPRHLRGSKKPTKIFYYDPLQNIHNGRLHVPSTVYDHQGFPVALTSLDSPETEIYLEPPFQTPLSPSEPNSTDPIAARQRQMTVKAPVSWGESKSQDQSIIVVTVAVMALLVGALSARRMRSRSFLSSCIENESLEDEVAYDTAYTVAGDSYHTFGWKGDLEKFDV